MEKPQETLDLLEEKEIYSDSIQDLLDNTDAFIKEISKKNPNIKITYSDCFSLTSWSKEEIIRISKKIPNPNYEAQMEAYQKWIIEDAEQKRNKRKLEEERAAKAREANLARRKKAEQEVLDKAARLQRRISGMTPEEQAAEIAEILRGQR